jgi:hypothetical protein
MKGVCTYAPTWTMVSNPNNERQSLRLERSYRISPLDFPYWGFRLFGRAISLPPCQKGIAAIGCFLELLLFGKRSGDIARNQASAHRQVPLPTPLLPHTSQKVTGSEEQIFC